MLFWLLYLCSISWNLSKFVGIISLACFFLFRDCFGYLRPFNCRAFSTSVKKFMVMLIESVLNLYGVWIRTIMFTIFLWHRTWRNWDKTDLEASSLRINSHIIRRHYARCQRRKATNLIACPWTPLTKIAPVVHFYLRGDQQRSNWVEVLLNAGNFILGSINLTSHL